MRFRGTHIYTQVIFHLISIDNFTNILNARAVVKPFGRQGGPNMLSIVICGRIRRSRSYRFVDNNPYFQEKALMPTIRNDVIKIGDKFATLIGDDVAVGQPAPEFTSVVTGWTPVNPLQ